MQQFEPVVFQMEPPHSRGPLSHLPKLPQFTPRTTKLLIATAAIVISLTLVGVVILSILVSNGSFRASHGLNINPQDQQQITGSTDSKAAKPGGGIATGIGGFTGTNSPVITITAEPATVTVGGKSVLKWSVSNSPISCTASDDWSGNKGATGEEQTVTLTKVQTYLFTLTCKTKTGTGFSTVSVGSNATGGTGSIATRPSVTLAANPTSIFKGDSSTLTWSVSNGPTSCTAGGDWSGAKPIAGPENTGQLSTSKSYSYTLTCSNSGGTGFATTTVLVNDPPPNTPIVTISSNPVGPVTPGSAVTLAWNATNNPTNCVASDDWSGNKAAGGSQSSGALNSIKTYKFTITCSNSTGGTYDSAAIQVLPNAPNVSLTATPNSIYVGASATLTWSATNNPTGCTASGDWSGGKSSGGTQSTGTLNSVKTYYYTLTCVNAGGTGFAKNIPVNVTNPPPPSVTLSVNPIAVTAGGSATLTWSATNNPTGCTASGDWSGGKSSGGTQSTGTLGIVKTYTYTLSCANAGGSDSSSTSVSVSSGGPSSAPVVTVGVNPTSIGTGSSSTLSWSATNSPTSCTSSGSWSGSKSSSGSQGTGTMSSAGSYTYSLSCTNAKGTGSSSATLTVIPTPVISISVSPNSINTGSSSTVSWSATNSPSSCTAGGSWSGSKAASGSQNTGAMNSAGTYTFSISCTNSGGTTSKNATLTVANVAPVYCSGNTPCYGQSDLAGHSAPGNCWGWNSDWVINITSFRPSHPGGIRSGSTSTIENSATVCDHDIHAILAGSAAIPGYKESGGSTTHGHKSATTNNSGGSALASYRVGYYDANKP